MSTIKKFLNDPRKLLFLGVLFLAIGFVDVMVFTDASSIMGMTWWGQTSVYIFMFMLGGMIISMGILPLGKWIFSLFKKK